MSQSVANKILTISIPTWNRDILVKELLQNLTEQITRHQLQNKIEVWVSDNCSTDKTEAIASEFVQQFDYVHYNRNETNIGLGPNVIKSMLLSRGKYNLLLGDDDRLKPDCLPKLVSFLETHPDTGLLIDTTNAKNNTINQPVSFGLTAFLKDYYWFMGNAGVFVTPVSYITDYHSDPKIAGVSFSWPQTQLMIIGSHKNPQNKIVLGSFDMISGTEHANITLYNSYYIWKVAYYELTVDIENIRSIVGNEVANAAREYFSKRANQMFFNILQCGVFLDNRKMRSKTRQHISGNLHHFSGKEKFLLRTILFVLWLPSFMSKFLSNIFIYLIRGKAGLKKKNDFIKQEKKKLAIINSKNKTIIREFSFEGAPS